jgi:hypothetical protein
MHFIRIWCISKLRGEEGRVGGGRGVFRSRESLLRGGIGSTRLKKSLGVENARGAQTDGIAGIN